MSQFLCVLQCGKPCDSDSKDSLFNIMTERWETIKKTSPGSGVDSISLDKFLGLG